MLNFYFTLENGNRHFYAITSDSKGYLELRDNRIIVILNKIGSIKITSLNIGDNNTEVTFEKGIKVIFNNNIFGINHDHYDNYFKGMEEKLLAFKEEEQIAKLKARRDRRINRERCKKIKTLIINSSLGLSLVLGSVGFTKLSPSLGSDKKDKDLDKDSGISLETTTRTRDTALINGEEYEVDGLDVEEESEEQEVTQEEQETITPRIIEEPTHTVSIDLSFTSLRDEVSRYSETDKFCGELIRYYSKRWGLSPELAIAQISQERPDIKNGECDNVCQLKGQFYENRSFKVPVYDDTGFTGTYDEFTVTSSSINTLEGNIMAGLATYAELRDQYGIMEGLFFYNQGPYAINLACEYYGLNVDDYIGDEKTIAARDLIVNYYKANGKNHGDPLYLEHVMARFPVNDGENINISCYRNGEKEEIAINRILEYNMSR